METAASMVTDVVEKCKGYKYLLEYCEEQGVKIIDYGVDERAKMFENHNVIVWGVRRRHESYIADGRNVLFIENGLLSQSG